MKNKRNNKHKRKIKDITKAIIEGGVKGNMKERLEKAEANSIKRKHLCLMLGVKCGVKRGNIPSETLQSSSTKLSSKLTFLTNN